MINEVVNNGFQPRLNAPTAGSTPAASVSEPIAKTPSPAQTEQTAPAAQPAVTDPSQIQQAISKLNDYVQSSQRKLSFSVSADTGQTVIKVFDLETDKLIRQIPSEDAIKLAASIDATTSSLFVQERA